MIEYIDREIWYFEIVVFPYIIHVIAQKGQLLPPPIDNVWESCKL